MAAEGGLLEESGHKAMILDHVDILLLEGALPTPQFLGESGVAVAGPEGVLARVVLLVVRHGSAAAVDAADTIDATAVTAATVADLPIDDESTRRRAPLNVGGVPRHSRAARRRGRRRPPRNLGQSAVRSTLGTLGYARAVRSALRRRSNLHGVETARGSCHTAPTTDDGVSRAHDA